MFVFQDQYVFIHDAILEAVTCGDTHIEANDLEDKLKKLQMKDQSGKTKLELQFAVSVHFVIWALSVIAVKLYHAIRDSDALLSAIDAGPDLF